MFVTRPSKRAAELFEQAINKQRFDMAWAHATDMAHVSLAQALRLTVLAGELEDPKFPRLARRFLVRFIREQAPTLDQVKRVADALDCIADDLPVPGGPRPALHALVKQLERLDD
jgi:hypothetical protein